MGQLSHHIYIKQLHDVTHCPSNINICTEEKLLITFSLKQEQHCTSVTWKIRLCVQIQDPTIPDITQGAVISPDPFIFPQTN